MARTNKNDFFSSLRSAGLRKGVAKTLADLEKSGKKTGNKAEELARQAVQDLRAAADTIEKRLNIGGAGTRAAAGKKAASTRKRTAAKRSASAKKAAATRARSTTKRSSTRKSTSAAKRATGTARKATTRATGTARKAAARATGARKTSARKSS
jgi:DNA-binding protein HU-beta